MFTLKWWRVVSLDLLARGQRACLQECFHPQRLLRFCLVKHYYGACFSTFRFVRRARDFLIQRHKLLWADSSRRRLQCSNWPQKCLGFAVRGYESSPETSEDTQPKLWHDEGMDSLTAGGVGHGSRDSILPIICRLSRSNGGHIFRHERRVGCLFSTDFCTHHENQTNLF